MSKFNDCRFTGYVHSVEGNENGTFLKIALKVLKSGKVEDPTKKNDFIDIKFLGADTVQAVQELGIKSGDYATVPCEFRMEEYNGQKRPAFVGSKFELPFNPKGDGFGGGGGNAQAGRAVNDAANEARNGGGSSGGAAADDGDDVPF